MDITFNNLRQVVARCWEDAETNTRSVITRKHPAPSEELVTDLFAGELRETVSEASRTKKIEAAFRADLHLAFPAIHFDVSRYASGLLARVNLHGRWHEGHVSAADFGIIITRPRILTSRDNTRIEFRRKRTTGLLAQAKLGRCAMSGVETYTWNYLTVPQERLFPERRQYYSLLLYRLSGQKQDALQAFSWQLCRKHTVEDVKEWLRTNAFPEEIISSDVVTGLFAGHIGTEDPEIIRTVIDPPSSSAHTIDIEIFWPDGAGPPPSVELRQDKQQVQLRIRH